MIEKEEVRQKLEQHKKHSEKWIMYFQKIELKINLQTTFFRKDSRIKQLVQEGIPERLRSIVWYKVLEIDDYKNKRDYFEYLQESETKFDEIEKIDDLIIKDIQRTFSKHPSLNEEYSETQHQLYRILRAYSVFNKRLGYCQGMAFICAYLLTQFDEPNTFWVLANLIDKFKLEGCMINGMPQLKLEFYKHMYLLQQYYPKMFECLICDKIPVSLYATEWFITLYTVNFPFQYLDRIFDLVIIKGKKMIHRLALKEISFKSNITEIPIDQRLQFMKQERNKENSHLHNGENLDQYLESLNQYKITNKQLQQIENEYFNSPNQQIIDYLD